MIKKLKRINSNALKWSKASLVLPTADAYHISDFSLAVLLESNNNSQSGFCSLSFHWPFCVIFRCSLICVGFHCLKNEIKSIEINVTKPNGVHVMNLCALIVCALAVPACQNNKTKITITTIQRTAHSHELCICQMLWGVWVVARRGRCKFNELCLSHRFIFNRNVSLIHIILL